MLSAGCSTLKLENLPTPYPTEYLPTVLAMTVEAGRQTRTAAALQTTASLSITTPQPTSTIQATVNPTDTQEVVIESPTAILPQVSSTVTRIPSKTPTFTATPVIPAAEIQILSPGPMSKFISPLEVSAYYHSLPGGYILVELIAEPLKEGEAGRLLFSKLQRFSSGGEAFWITAREALEFEISRVSELAVLRYSIFDSYDRLVAVTSVDYVLLQVGQNEINPSASLLEPISIFEPNMNKLIQGGSLSVSGMARPDGDQILHIELVTQDNRVVGTHDFFTTATADGKHVPFSTTVDYQVSGATWVRLIIYYHDVRIPGYRQLSSVPILLSP